MVRYLTSGVLFAACMCGTGCADETKSVEITPKDFSAVYPAVWFAPSDGTVVGLKVKSEKPPEDKFLIWIEPDDPEVSTLSPALAKDGTRGFQFLGEGPDVFRHAALPKDRKLIARILATDLGKKQPVFLFIDKENAWVMMIDSVSRADRTIKFQWKPLATK